MKKIYISSFKTTTYNKKEVNYVSIKDKGIRKIYYSDINKNAIKDIKKKFYYTFSTRVELKESYLIKMKNKIDSIHAKMRTKVFLSSYKKVKLFVGYFYVEGYKDELLLKYLHNIEKVIF